MQNSAHLFEVLDHENKMEQTKRSTFKKIFYLARQKKLDRT